MASNVHQLRLWNDFSAKAWQVFASNFENSSSSVERLIDFGCGTGETTEKIAEWILELNRKSGDDCSKLSVTGIDLIPANVTNCKNVCKSSAILEFNFKEADFGDVSTFPPEWESAFDLVTSCLSVHFVKNQSEVLRNIRYCLKPGGHFFIYCQTGYDGIPNGTDTRNETSTNQQEQLKPYSVTRAGLGVLPKYSEYFPPGGFSAALFPGQAAYHPWGLPDPAAGFAQLSVDAGFRILDARNALFTYDFDGEAELEKTVKQLALSVERLPAAKRDEFAVDFVAEYKKIRPLDEREAGRKLGLEMGVIIVVGEKV